MRWTRRKRLLLQNVVKRTKTKREPKPACARLPHQVNPEKVNMKHEIFVLYNRTYLHLALATHFSVYAVMLLQYVVL